MHSVDNMITCHCRNRSTLTSKGTYQNEITYLFTKHARSKGTILNIFETEEKREERKHNFNTEIDLNHIKYLMSKS